MIVPVWVSSKYNHNEILVYALLDTQSDTTFILEHIVGAISQKTALKLTTISSQNEKINCKLIQDLTVRGYQSEVVIPLPTTYTRNFIPADVNHIPTDETAQRWPHLNVISQKIPPLQDCEIGLLIGYNCSQALIPRSFLTGRNDQPFAIETDLGWSIIGTSDSREDIGDPIGFTNRIITREIPVKLRPLITTKTKIDDMNRFPKEVHYTYTSELKETTIPYETRETLELPPISQDDILFLDMMEKTIHENDEKHIEMPLPFKKRPSLPCNKVMAFHRLEHLKRRLSTNKKYASDYTAFMTSIVERGEAEEVSADNADCKSPWYIPHHGIYHPKKPDKLRVVFDCSARYKGTSLNEHLLTGPDLTNALVGVLCRFRQEPIAVMCDIEGMFHQFHVNPEDRDYLRFLWWKDGKLDTQPKEYRMKVHLFGAASSPGCANYGLKYIATMNKERYGAESTDFIKRNFYVDDGLISINNLEEAIGLIKNVRDMCASGSLRLHKFISNNRDVIESIPKSECAMEIKD